MNRKYHVRLSEKERAKIQEHLNSRETPQGIRKRCSVLLQADESIGKPLSYEEMSQRIGVSDVTVYNVIKEYATQGLLYSLRRRHPATPPNPPIVSGEKEARIVALACGAAPEGRTRWTVRLLAEKVVELGIMEAVSHETIRTTLKKRNLNLT